MHAHDRTGYETCPVRFLADLGIQKCPRGAGIRVTWEEIRNLLIKEIEIDSGF
jgi:hypothetical protein